MPYVPAQKKPDWMPEVIWNLVQDPTNLATTEIPVEGGEVTGPLLTLGEKVGEGALHEITRAFPHAPKAAAVAGHAIKGLGRAAKSQFTTLAQNNLITQGIDKMVREPGGDIPLPTPNGGADFDLPPEGQMDPRLAGLKKVRP